MNKNSKKKKLLRPKDKDLVHSIEYSELITSENHESAHVKNVSKENFMRKWQWILLEVLSVLFWFYTLIKLFIFDFDVYLASKFLPSFQWILNFKLIIILISISSVWLITRNGKFIFSILYVTFYPLILLLWKFPYFIFKQKSWILAFAVFGFLVSRFKSFKANFISASILIAISVFVISFSQTLILYFCLIFLLFLLIFLYYSMLRYSFQPSLAFDLQTKIITKFSDSMKTAMKLDDELKEIALSSMDDKQLQKWSTPVQFAVVMNKFMYFFASKLKDLQKSRVNYLTYILTIFLSIVLVVHVFAIANFALYKLDSSSFFVAFKPNLLHFYDYSINCFFTSSLNDFYPLSGLARLVYTMEIVAAFGIVVIIFSLIFSVASNKHEEEIYQAIKTIKEKGEDLDSFILQEYKLSTDKAIEELYKLKAGFIKIIYYFAKNIE